MTCCNQRWSVSLQVRRATLACLPAPLHGAAAARTCWPRAWQVAVSVCCLASQLSLSHLLRAAHPLLALQTCQLLPAPASSVLGAAVLLSHLLSRALAERPFNSSDAPAWFEATAKLARRKLQARTFARMHTLLLRGMQR